jgi:hypothetical protein
MATRTKTIEYWFDVDTSDLSSGVRRDFSAITAYIPESSVTFKSVILQCIVAAHASQDMTEVIMGIKLGAVAFSDTTVSENITDSGETYWLATAADVTDYFTTNWTGTSMTCQAGVEYTGVSTTANHCARLIITYEYEDSTSTTRAKTIRIPIESDVSELTTAGGWTAIGGTTPIIDTDDLPEDSVTIRQAVLEITGFQGGNGTGDFTLEYRINGGTGVEFHSAEMGSNASHEIIAYCDVTSDLSTTAYSLEMQCVGADAGDRLGAVLSITYEYNHTNSTTIWNSLILELPSGENVETVASYNGSDYATSGILPVWIEEPGTITLKQSAACMRFAGQGNDPSVKVGSQASYTAYSYPNVTRDIGERPFIHKFDSTGQGGSGITLGRGRNDFVLNYHWISPGAFCGMTGYIILNYTSGKASDGDGVHNHSVCYGLIYSDDDMYDKVAETPSEVTLFDPPESDFFLNSCVPVFYPLDLYPDYRFYASYEGSEGPGGDGLGNFNIANLGGMWDTERVSFSVYGQCVGRGVIQRWSDSAETKKADPTDSRTIIKWSLGNDMLHAYCWTTYHSITTTASGTISNYAGDGSGIEVELHDAADHALLKTTTTATGGTFSFTWFDDSRNLYCVAREDSTHVGRSDNGNAS